MSVRLHPYRNKPTPHILSLLTSASHSTFFLVQEPGPTSFVLKDDSDRKYKLSLGDSLSCSCGAAGTEHCIHTLYALLKIFKLQPENPLIWQISYIDTDIAFLCRNRYAPMPHSKPKAASKPASSSNRVPLTEEFCCPICQEDLKDTENLIWCKGGCGHNLHVRCMNIWANHKLSEREKITCPMCRRDWGPAAIGELKRLLVEFQAKARAGSKHDNTVCGNCLVHPISGQRYHCLVCDCFDLCRKCYKSGLHRHHPTIKRASPADVWRPVAARRGARPGAELEGRELSPNDYEALLALDSHSGVSLFDFLAELLPDAEAGGTCEYCHMEQLIPWKALPCGHTLHKRCLHDLFQEEKNECSVDGRVIWLGLESSKA